MRYIASIYSMTDCLIHIDMFSPDTLSFFPLSFSVISSFSPTSLKTDKMWIYLNRSVFIWIGLISSELVWFCPCLSDLFCVYLRGSARHWLGWHCCIWKHFISYPSPQKNIALTYNFKSAEGKWEVHNINNRNSFLKCFYQLKQLLEVSAM